MAKILCVLTGASYWILRDGHRHPTGYWAEEFVAPYSVLHRTESGFLGPARERTRQGPGAGGMKVVAGLSGVKAMPQTCWIVR